MKKLNFIAALVLMQIFTAGLYAQTATATAISANGTKAKATATTMAKEMKSSTKTDGKQTSASSVAIQDSGLAYSMSAIFDVHKTKEIRQLLVNNVDRQYFSAGNGTAQWKKEENGNTAYSFVLSEGRLKINIDRELVAPSAYEKFRALGEKISVVISAK